MFLFFCLQTINWSLPVNKSLICGRFQQVTTCVRLSAGDSSAGLNQTCPGPSKSASVDLMRPNRPVPSQNQPLCPLQTSVSCRLRRYLEHSGARRKLWSWRTRERIMFTGCLCSGGRRTTGSRITDEKAKLFMLLIAKITALHFILKILHVDPLLWTRRINSLICIMLFF